jgi:D-inositol-3-phosphate glycosyltransferase
VVASDLPTGVTDVTVHETTGLLMPPNDSTALADALARLINDRPLAVRLGLAGRDRARRLFTMDIFEKRVGTLFGAVMGREPLEDLLLPFKTPSEAGMSSRASDLRLT